MGKKYLIVSKEILPDYYEKVIEARNLLNDGKVKGISEAVKMVGISRSTYYKYKDYVFAPSDNSMGRKALISMMLDHKKGVLSEVINYLSSVDGNILTINQVAEVGRQPWAIQDMLPVGAAISRLQTGSVQVTFFIFLLLFTVLLLAETGILLKAIKKGPEIVDS